MRRAIGVVLCLGVFATGVLAQDYIFTNFATPVDQVVPQAPCLLQGSAQPVVHDSSLWVFYTCSDNRVIARRFIHPNDKADWIYPKPVIVVTPTPVPPPAPTTTGCPGNMVAGQFGGCVPPDHPLAGAR